MELGKDAVCFSLTPPPATPGALEHQFRLNGSLLEAGKPVN